MISVCLPAGGLRRVFLKRRWMGMAAVLFGLCSGGDAELMAHSPEHESPLVGAYYYPWYRGGDMGQWRQVLRTRLVPRQEPKAGYHDSRDGEVIAEHIRQSVRAGLDFWAVSWWGERNQPAERAFQEAILRHPDAGKLKYAVLYESEGRLGSPRGPRYDRFLADLAYLRDTYFDHPQYLRIDGRPVVFVYLTRVYFRDQGQETLNLVRERFPEIYLVGDDVFSGPGQADTYRGDWAKPFDAVTPYDVYGQSVGPLGGTAAAIDHLAQAYAHARAEANRVGVGFVPAVSPGFNDTAVREGHPGRARYFTDRDDSEEGDLFRAMIRQAGLPNLDPRAGRMLMVTSFNEWFEDTQIEATAGVADATRDDDSPSGEALTGGDRYVDYGPLYLDILRQETK